MKISLFNPERRIRKQLGAFLRNYPLNKIAQAAEKTGIEDVVAPLQEQQGELYFPDFFKHMVLAIWEKISRRAGLGRSKGGFEVAMIIAFEFLKKYGYVNRGSVMRNIRLTNKGSRRNIYHADGQCSRSRAEAESKSSKFDTLFRQYFRSTPQPRSAPTIGQPAGISPNLD